MSGNPEGRKPTHFGKYIREHPSTPLVIEKIMTSALDDDDPRQKDAWKLIANKVAPDLKAQEIKADLATHIGVISLPAKQEINVLAPPTPLPHIIDPPSSVPQIESVKPESFPQEKDLPPTSEIGVPKAVNGTKDKI